LSETHHILFPINCELTTGIYSDFIKANDAILNPSFKHINIKIGVFGSLIGHDVSYIF